MAFDPLDPQYQVSADFPPDKFSTWTYPKEEMSWILAHNALRAETKEFRQAFEAIQKRGGIKSAWEVKAIQEAFTAHYIHIHAHHSNEDDILTPFLMTRAKLPEKVSSDLTLLAHWSFPVTRRGSR